MAQSRSDVLQTLTERIKRQIQGWRAERSFTLLEQDAAAKPRPHSCRSFFSEHPLLIPELTACHCLSERPAWTLEQQLELCPQDSVFLLHTSWEHPDDLGLDALRVLRQQRPQACLMLRELVVDEYQILLARSAGVNALTLIPEVLGPRRLQIYSNKARFWGLEPILELYHPRELALAAELGVETLYLTHRPGEAMLWTAAELRGVNERFAHLIVQTSDTELALQALQCGIRLWTPGFGLWRDVDAAAQMTLYRHLLASV